MTGGRQSSRHDAAQRYAAHGWPVFPCIPGEKVPSTAHGCKDATTDPERIAEWWERSPGRNVAIATGAPGPDVLDVDRHGEQSGFPALSELKRTGLVGKPQAMVRTPSGGAHLYFRGTEHQGNGHIEAAHVDFRSNGGYVVAPPSLVKGRRYEVVSHQASADTFDWAVAKALLAPQPEHREWQPRGDGQPSSLDHLVRYVAECDDHVNDRLYWAACRMAEAGRHDRLPELIRAAYDAGEDRHGQAERTIESALRTTGARAAQRTAEPEPRPFPACQPEREREAG